MLRYGRYVFLTSERLAKAEAFFVKRGAAVVTVARFLEGLRQAFSIIVGVTEMPWLRFLAFSSLGAVLWIGVWAAVGDLAGTHIGVIYQQVTRYLLYVLAGPGGARRRADRLVRPAPSPPRPVLTWAGPGPATPAGPGHTAGWIRPVTPPRTAAGGWSPGSR